MSVAVDSHGGKNATYHGDLPNAISGKVGFGQNLDGDGDYADRDVIDTTISALTISFWVKRNGTPSSRENILLHYKDGTHWAGVYIETDGTIVFKDQDGGGTQKTISSNTNICDNDWHWICVTRASNGNVVIYVDNSSDGSGNSNNGDISLSGGTTYISYDPGDAAGGTYFAGYLDELGVWNEDIDSDDRADVYNSGNGKAYGSLAAGTKTNMISYYKLEEGGVSNVRSQGYIYG